MAMTSTNKVQRQHWKLLKVLSDRVEADRLAAFLQSADVPAYVDHGALNLGLDGGFRVFVAAQLAHRARWLLTQPDMTDSELTFLATGKLPGAED